MAPIVQKAVVVQQDGSVALREIAVPKPGPDEILVKVVAAAQNPADCGWKLAYANLHTAHLTFFWVLSGKTALYGRRVGAISGFDFSGIVEEIGSNVPHGLRSIGERVAGLVLGGLSCSFCLTHMAWPHRRSHIEKPYVYRDRGPAQRRIFRISHHVRGLCRPSA